MRTLLHSCGRWQFVSSWCQLCGSHYQEDAAKSTLSHLHFVFAHIETWLRTVGFPPVCERAKTEMCWLKTRADKLFLRYRRNRKFPSQVLCAFANMVFPGQSAWPMKCFFFFFPMWAFSQRPKFQMFKLAAQYCLWFATKQLPHTDIPSPQSPQCSPWCLGWILSKIHLRHEMNLNLYCQCRPRDIQIATLLPDAKL